MGSNERSHDPYGSFRFKVIFDQGGPEAYFQSVSGLSITTEVFAQKEGGVNDFVHQLKGQTTYTPIVLKRGVTRSESFFTWMTRSANNQEMKNQRKNGTIQLLSEDGTKISEWKFIRGWPTKWEGGSFDASSSAALVETLEIAHEGLS